MKRKKMTSMIGFWIPDRERALIEDLADREEKALSEVARELLAAGMEARGLTA